MKLQAPQSNPVSFQHVKAEAVFNDVAGNIPKTDFHQIFSPSTERLTQAPGVVEQVPRVLGGRVLTERERAELQSQLSAQNAQPASPHGSATPPTFEAPSQAQSSGTPTAFNPSVGFAYNHQQHGA